MSSKNVAERLLAAALVVGCVVLAAPPARAQRTDADVKVAQSLFDEGRTLMKSGQYTQACPKLAESQRLDPALGTLLNLALCHRLEGRLATAWTEFHDAVGLARQQDRADREKYALAQLGEIEPHISQLTITLAPGAAEPTLEVTLDGTVVGEAALGTPIKIDPGTHHIEARARGKQTWGVDVQVGADTDQKSIAISPLSATHVSMVSQGTKRTAGWIVGGAGVAALGVGVLSGLQASSKWSQRNDACVADVCSAAGLAADKNARRWATVTDVALALGAIGLGVGTYLVLTSGTRVEVRTEVGARGGAVTVGAAW